MKPDFEVIMLGSGTGVPSLEQRSPGILVKVRGKVLILDLGPGNLIKREFPASKGGGESLILRLP